MGWGRELAGLFRCFGIEQAQLPPQEARLWQVGGADQLDFSGCTEKFEST
jgi:hypothetical protein